MWCKSRTCPGTNNSLTGVSGVTLVQSSSKPPVKGYGNFSSANWRGCWIEEGVLARDFIRTCTRSTSTFANSHSSPTPVPGTRAHTRLSSRRLAKAQPELKTDHSSVKQYRYFGTEPVLSVISSKTRVLTSVLSTELIYHLTSFLK